MLESLAQTRLGLTWWPAACFVVWVAGLGHSACISTLLLPLLGTPSHTHNRSPAPDGLPHLTEKPFQIRIWFKNAAGNISNEVLQHTVYYKIMSACLCVCVPSTSAVRSVTLAALRRPAGRLRPIFSRRSRRQRPPFFDFALRKETERCLTLLTCSH